MSFDEVDATVVNLRMGLVMFAVGGGFSLSVLADDRLLPSGLFTFRGPLFDELPSNTINGLFLLESLPCAGDGAYAPRVLATVLPQRLDGRVLWGSGMTWRR